MWSFPADTVEGCLASVLWGLPLADEPCGLPGVTGTCAHRACDTGSDTAVTHDLDLKDTDPMNGRSAKSVQIAQLIHRF